MLSAGIEAAFANPTASLNRALPVMSPPPIRAATVISLLIFVKTLPRFASAAPFLCLMLLHLLWPDILVLPLQSPRIARATGLLNGDRTPRARRTRSLVSPAFLHLSA